MNIIRTIDEQIKKECSNCKIDPVDRPLNENCLDCLSSQNVWGSYSPNGWMSRVDKNYCRSCKRFDGESPCNEYDGDRKIKSQLLCLNYLIK